VSGSDHAALEQAVRDATKDAATRAEPIETGLEDVFIYLMSRSTDNFKVRS
jgi:ABC-2 type transport system ATP-binding protein